MTIYNYKAMKDGKEYSGTLDVENKQVLYKQVRDEGGTIIEAKEGKVKGAGIKFKFITLSNIKTEEKIAFAKNLAVMIQAGISMSRGLAIMAKQTTNKALFKVLNSLSESIDKGKSLSEGMADHKDVFSNLFIMMVKSGEESGKIVESLRTVAGQLERSDQLSKKIKGAMIYPTIIMIVMLILGVLLLVYMVPTLTATFKGLNVELPLPTRIIVAMSDFLINNAIILLIAVIGLVSGISYYLKTPKGSRFKDFLVLHLPLITPIVREVNSARTARTLSSLVSSGVDILIAIGVTKDVIQNSYYKEVLEKAGEVIQKGGSISAVLSENTKLYPIFVGEMASVGEETGQLSPMLENIAVFYESEVDQRTKDLSTIIEPILMVIIGIGVGVFAIAMLMPTYSLVDVIN